MKSKNKYIIRESELREIIRETLLMELYNPADYKGLYDKNSKGRLNFKDYWKTGADLIKNLPKLPGLVIPDDVKDRIESGDSQALQWLLGVLGANTAGRMGPDFFPDFSTIRQHGFKALNYGDNGNAEQGFNATAAAQYAMSRAYPAYNKRTCGHCARAVRQALNYGGLGVPHGMPAGYARDYLKVLPANGWQEIMPGQAGQVGDIVVVAPFRDAVKDYKSGHIAICCGNGQWVSDFRQSTPHGLATPPPANAVHYYRYRNIVG